MLIPKVLAFLALSLPACVPAQPSTRLEPEREIRYVSTDLSRVLVFERDGARFGDSLALSRGIWPTQPVEIFPAGSGVQCISIGPHRSSSTVQFAIKRPLRVADRYSCLRSTFRVIRCFENCSAAVIEVSSPGGGRNPKHDPLKSYLYVDGCRGLLAYSSTDNLALAMPLNAVWLRGDIGVLADPRGPTCDMRIAESN